VAVPKEVAMKVLEMSSVRVMAVLAALLIFVCFFAYGWVSQESLGLYEYLKGDHYLVSANKLFCAYVRDGRLVIEYGSKPDSTGDFSYESGVHRKDARLVFTIARSCACGHVVHLQECASCACCELTETGHYSSRYNWAFLGLVDGDKAQAVAENGKNYCCSEAITELWRTVPPYHVRRLWKGELTTGVSPPEKGLVTLSDGGQLQVHALDTAMSHVIASLGEHRTITSLSFESDEDYSGNISPVRTTPESSAVYVFQNAGSQPVTISREQIQEVTKYEKTKFKSKKEFEWYEEVSITVKKAMFAGTGSGQIKLTVGGKQKIETEFEKVNELETETTNALREDVEIPAFTITTITVRSTVSSWTAPIRGKYTVEFDNGDKVTVDGEIEAEFWANAVTAVYNTAPVLEITHLTEESVEIKNNGESAQGNIQGAGDLSLANWGLAIYCHCRESGTSGDFHRPGIPRVGEPYPENFDDYYSLARESNKTTLAPGDTLRFDLDFDPATCECSSEDPLLGTYYVLVDSEGQVYEVKYVKYIG
jgi:hypothetical protein